VPPPVAATMSCWPARIASAMLVSSAKKWISTFATLTGPPQ
jgi:hypothetical protein